MYILNDYNLSYKSSSTLIKLNSLPLMYPGEDLGFCEGEDRAIPVVDL